MGQKRFVANENSSIEGNSGNEIENEYDCRKEGRKVFSVTGQVELPV